MNLDVLYRGASSWLDCVAMLAKLHEFELEKGAVISWEV